MPLPRHRDAFRCRLSVVLIAAALAGCLPGHSATAAAQHTPLQPPVPDAASVPQHRTRLYLRDGSYQVVLSYSVAGDVVHYRSAERNGAAEELPLALVDLPRTQRWLTDHSPQADGEALPPVLSPELQREEADRAARTPLVAPNLRLPDEDSVLVLDTFHDTPELVPLAQSGGDLNHETAHNMLRRTLNPLASAHQILELKGERADVQLHVPDPVFYVRLEVKGDDSYTGGGFVVDTSSTGTQGGGKEPPAGSSEKSAYVLVRTQIDVGTREVASFRINLLGGVKRQADVLELNETTLPGGHWLRLTPKQPLEQGEYALMEVVDDRTVNLGVWDFGVHPTAPENAEAIRPETPRKPGLARRPQPE